MSEPNPFDLLIDRIVAAVRQEIKATSGNGGPLLTAEQLAKALQINRATIYEWVKEKKIPHYEAGRFVRFNLTEVLESLRKKGSPC